ncbi:5'-methylthioadenosine/adenosylhomocysteine nucleosidase [Borreliella yangtzensis]|uniref:adenosylhomocysteine nucleosidase n=1 Tax=Borreliella yangtzensis TaxID=683292 RepID=A0ABR6P9C5_9SPIR|nr:5'-methylthioadenosine/adenosylhomocysteine nucleosidase [Borreliella yangtzensis]MBB6042826.1 adenosylhomocysteine nucleosidase [Borreliella yangtzensis]WKC73782.1 5'-methylthioadenosine/adenosylhomocysteine nucleosidase [Borreliella yangtzensis]WKC74699.1 5'-methylthioadenosine/adenosylhomocysteine nucleosidase [Borreliella yangtzensis]
MKIKNIANPLILFLSIVLNSWGNETNVPNGNYQNNILILSATKAEIEEINKIIQNKKSISIEELRRKKTITIGKMLDHNIIAIATGVGKINTAFWTSYIISKYKISHIINAGVASGIYSNKNKFIKIGDVIISTETTSYDFNLHRFGYEIGHVPEHPKKFKANTSLVRKASKIKINKITSYMGLIITGDQFIDHQNFQEIPEEFENAIAIDMESAAMAQVAYNFKIPFIIIRGISDIVNNENNHDDYKKFLKKASYNSAKIVEKLIKLM